MVPYLALLCTHSLSKPLEFILRNLSFVQKGFCSPHFPELATVRENLFENDQGPLMVTHLTLLCAHSLKKAPEFINHAKVFCNPYFPVLAALRENLFENV